MSDDLFDEPRVSGDAGDFWPGKVGTYKGQLREFAKGPVFENVDKDGNKKDSPQVRWVFDVYKLDGTRVQYIPESGPNEGKTQDADKDGLSSTTISQKSKAGEWFGALLARDIDFAKESAADLRAEAVGKWGLLVLAKNDNQRVVIKTVGRLDND